MLQYLLFKALADERTRDVVEAARRHQLVAEAIRQPSEASSPSSHLRDVTARMVALLSGRRAPNPHASGSRLTSASGAGPIGCAT